MKKRIPHRDKLLLRQIFSCSSFWVIVTRFKGQSYIWSSWWWELSPFLWFVQADDPRPVSLLAASSKRCLIRIAVLPVSLERVTLPTRTESEVVKYDCVNWILISPTVLLISAEVQLAGIPPLRGEERENLGEEVKFEDRGETNYWNCVEQIKVFVVNSGSNWPCASPKIKTSKYPWHSGWWLGEGEHCSLFKMHFWTYPFGQVFSAPPKIMICSCMHKFTLTVCLGDKEVSWFPFCRLGSLNDLSRVTMENPSGSREEPWVCSAPLQLDTGTSQHLRNY